MSRMKRKDFSRKATGTFTLNVTSMTDMFTLLLVFLLQNYAATTVEMDTDAKLRLPQSSTMKEPTLGPQILVSDSVVKVDGVVVMNLENGMPKAQDLDNTNKNIVNPLLEVLKAKAKIANEKLMQETGKTDSSIILQANFDRDMGQLEPFLTTISAAGFAKVKLATVLGR